MKVESKIIPGSKVEITITDSAKEFEKARKSVLSEIAKNVQIKGFRKGAEIPEELLVKEVGAAAIDERAVNHYINANYQTMLAEAKIVPVAAGVVTDIVSLSPLSIKIEVEVLPTVTLDTKKMEKISIKKTEVTVTDEEVEAGIKDIERRFTHYHDAGEANKDGFEGGSAAIEKGDRVTLDTQGFESQGGKEIPETKVQAFPLVIGSGQFIPGFEDKLVGHKSWDVVEFEITFPADYHAEEFKSRKVYFMTTIFKVEKPHTPKWDEGFIEKLRGVKTDLAGFKDILKKEILGEKERRAREADEAKLLSELEKIATYELGEGIIARETDIIFHEQKANLESQGYNMKTYLEHMKMSETQYKKEVIEQEARRRVSAELILKAVRDTKNMEASDDEIQIEINNIISQYSNAEVIKRLKEKLVPGDAYYEDIKTRLAYRKVVDTFFA